MGLPAQARRLERRRPGAEPPPPPAPGFFEGVYANARAGDTAAIRNAQVYEAEQDAVADIAQRLIAMGEDPAKLRNAFGESQSLKDWLQGWNVDRVLEAAGKRKAANPKAFGNLDTDAERWRAQIAAPIDQRYSGVLDTAARSTMTQRIVGGLWGGAAEPENVATMGIAAGGRTIAETVIRNMALQTKVEAVSVVPRALEKTVRGEDASTGTLLTESAMAVVGSSVFEGVGKGIELGAPKVGDAVASGRERALAAIWDKLPESVRNRWGSAAKVPEEELPGLAELAIGRENMTPDERAAVDVLRREAEIEATNPFIADGAGVKAHREGVGEAMRRILSNMPDPLPPPAALPSGSPVPRLRGSTAISTTTVGVEGATVLKSRIKQVESSGNLNARPIDPKTGKLRSTALGPYQFIKSTWRTMYKRRFGETGEDDAAILAKRTNPQINELLIDDLIGMNARALQRAGHAADAGNLYLAHFAGPDGARRLLDADPQASARDMLGGRAVTANPFLASMSASDVVQWAHRKMGGSHAQVSSTGQGWRDRLQQQLDETEADLARLDAEEGDLPDMQAALAEVADEVAVPGDDIDLPVLDAPAPRAVEPSTPPEVLALLPPLRTIVGQRDRSLNKLDPIAQELGVSPDQVRRGLMELVGRGSLRMNRKTGTFMRPPPDGPMELLKFVARAGGLRDDAGHSLGLVGLSAKEQRELTKGAKRNALRKREGNREDSWQRFIPGAGPLLRHEGKSVDAMGELLVEGGYFHGKISGDSWDESEVLELIERALKGEKIYPRGDDPELPEPFMDKDGWQPGELEHYSQGIDDAAEAAGIVLDDAQRLEIARIRKASIYEDGAEGPIDADAALIRLANEEAERAQFDAVAESDEIDYEAQYDAISRGDAGEDGAVGEDGGGPAPDARDAGAQRAGGDAVGGSDQASREALAQFDDPHGSGADSQIESVAHDLRMAVQAVAAPIGKVHATGERVRVFGPLPDRGVAPAFLGNDGNIYVGRAGENHLSAITPELRKMGQKGTGFATADGLFLNRAEALEYVNANGERITPSESMKGELDALDYRNQSAFIPPDMWSTRREKWERDNPWWTGERYFSQPIEKMPSLPPAPARSLWPATDDAVGWDAIMRPLDEEQRIALVSSLWGNDAVYSAALEAQGRVGDAEFQAGAPVREAAAIADAKGQAAVLRAHMDAGGTLTSTTARTQLTINKPDQLQVADDGTVLMMERGKFVALTPQQREQLARRVGWKPDVVEPDMFGGATPADVRASLERQGEGRSKGKGEQKAPGSDGGLFDVRAQDVEFGFRIDDEGDVVNPADLFAEFDAEDAAIKSIRDCLE